MSTLTLSDCIRRSHAAEQRAELLQLGTEQPPPQDLIDGWLSLRDQLLDSWKTMLSGLYDEDVWLDTESWGEAWEAIINRNARAILLDRRLIRQRYDKGGLLRLDELDRAVAEIRQLKKEFQDRWPRVDYQRIDNSLKDFERGEYYSAEQLIADERQGQDEQVG